MDDPRLTLAETVTAEAGRQALAAFRSDIGAVRTKRGPHDVVTETDERIERSVAQSLLSAFPGDGMVGEEGTSDRESGPGSPGPSTRWTGHGTSRPGSRTGAW